MRPASCLTTHPFHRVLIIFLARSLTDWFRTTYISRSVIGCFVLKFIGSSLVSLSQGRVPSFVDHPSYVISFLLAFCLVRSDSIESASLSSHMRYAAPATIALNLAAALYKMRSLSHLVEEAGVLGSAATLVYGTLAFSACNLLMVLEAFFLQHAKSTPQPQPQPQPPQTQLQQPRSQQQQAPSPPQPLPPFLARSSASPSQQPSQPPPAPPLPPPLVIGVSLDGAPPTSAPAAPGPSSTAPATPNLRTTLVRHFVYIALLLGAHSTASRLAFSVAKVKRRGRGAQTLASHPRLTPSPHTLASHALPKSHSLARYTLSASSARARTHPHLLRHPRACFLPPIHLPIHPLPGDCSRLPLRQLQPRSPAGLVTVRRLPARLQRQLPTRPDLRNAANPIADEAAHAAAPGGNGGELARSPAVVAARRPLDVLLRRCAIAVRAAGDELAEA